MSERGWRDILFPGASVMKNYSALLVILMLLIAYRLTNLQGKLNDVSDAVQDFQQQASMRWPRNGLLDDKEYLVDSALGSLSITWDASERLAQYQVDWPVGPTRTINSLLNYAARNVSGSGNSLPLWPRTRSPPGHSRPRWQTLRLDALGAVTTHVDKEIKADFRQRRSQCAALRNAGLREDVARRA